MCVSVCVWESRGEPHNISDMAKYLARKYVTYYTQALFDSVRIKVKEKNNYILPCVFKGQACNPLS